MILWNNLSQEQKEKHFESFEAEASSDRIHCLLLYDEDGHATVEDLVQDEAFWNEHSALTDGHCVCIGVKNSSPSTNGTSKKTGTATRLIGLFGCEPNELPCLVVCQMLRWSNAMRHMVVPLARASTSEVGCSEAKNILKRVAQDMHNMLSGHFADGYFLYIGIEYLLGDLTSKRGLIAAQAVWNSLKETA